MVIVSAKVSKRKVLIGILAAVAVIMLLSFLLKKAEEPSSAPRVDAETQTQPQNLEGGSNDDRLAFLQSYGWDVDATPTETREVRIPQEFNDVFTRYNELQQEQGFDLSEFAGKTAKRYVYAIKNHPGGGDDHYATVLVHKNKIIGGDVTSTGQGGSMHGFAMPS